MPELMHYPPGYDGELRPAVWAVVYRDETEPALPEYVGMVYESVVIPIGVSFFPDGGNIVRVIATYLSMVPSDATPEEAVRKAAAWAKRTDERCTDCHFWGVVRKQ